MRFERLHQSFNQLGHGSDEFGLLLGPDEDSGLPKYGNIAEKAEAEPSSLCAVRAKKQCAAGMENFKAWLPKSSVASCYLDLQALLRDGLRTECGLFPSSRSHHPPRSHRAPARPATAAGGATGSTKRLAAMSSVRKASEHRDYHSQEARQPPCPERARLSGSQRHRAAPAERPSGNPLPIAALSPLAASRRRRQHRRRHAAPQQTEPTVLVAVHTYWTSGGAPPTFGRAWERTPREPTARESAAGALSPPAETRQERARRVQETREAIQRANAQRKEAIASRVERRRCEVKEAERRREQAALTLTIVAAAATAAALFRGLERAVGGQNVAGTRDVAAAVVQRAWRRHFNRRILRPLLALRHLKARFSLRVRIDRKRRAAAVLVTFLRAALSSGGGPRRLVQRYLTAVRRCQASVRAFLACRRARLALLTRHWTKIEAEVRHDMAAVVEKQRRRLQRVVSVPPGDDKLHARWQRLHQKSLQLLWRADRIQRNLARIRAEDERRQLQRRQRRQQERVDERRRLQRLHGSGSSYSDGDSEDDDSRRGGEESGRSGGRNGGGGGSDDVVSMSSSGSPRPANETQTTPRRPPPPPRLASGDSVQDLARLGVPAWRRTEVIRYQVRLKCRLHAAAQRRVTGRCHNRLIDEREAALLIAGDLQATWEILGAASGSSADARTGSSGRPTTADSASISSSQPSETVATADAPGMTRQRGRGDGGGDGGGGGGELQRGPRSGLSPPAVRMQRMQPLLLTGNELGRSWRSVVEEEVVATWRAAVDAREEPSPYLRLDQLLPPPAEGGAIAGIGREGAAAAGTDQGPVGELGGLPTDVLHNSSVWGATGKAK